MKTSQAVTRFMDYQKMNAGKKYGQKLWPIPKKI
jgi:hypothetical protein